LELKRINNIGLVQEKRDSKEQDWTNGVIVQILGYVELGLGEETEVHPKMEISVLWNHHMI
jgi:hypothetical protein